MYIFNTLTVLPKLPKNIEGLDKIANNLCGHGIQNI